jgi:UDP-2,3-diacylglucosamine hydrolase
MTDAPPSAIPDSPRSSPPTTEPVETLFISDLHLSAERPATVELLLGFLAGRARQASRLFILGDFFDAWIGDDEDAPPIPDVISALRGLTAAGTACFLMHGNRDFLIGRRFCRATGCALLKDPFLTAFDGEPTLLMHGDLLCTDDQAYQRFRRRVRNPLIQRLFLWKSLVSRRALAADYRRKSAAANAGKNEQIMDVNQSTVAEYLRRFGAARLIHGHTHRPGEHLLSLAGGQARRLVLAEWHEGRGEVLVHQSGAWRRERVTAD